MTISVIKTSFLTRASMASALLLAACADGAGPADPRPEADAPIAVTGGRASFEEFKAQTFDETLGAYLVEEDIVLDEDELHTYYDTNVTGSGALAVFVDSSGNRKVWNASEKRNLTFCVSTDFGADFGRVVAAMLDATSSWENVIDVEFVRVASRDASCNSTNGMRIPVTKAAANATFLGGSNARSGIILNVAKFDARKAADRTDPLSLAGVLRHELGHSLGFPHEHERVAQTNPNCLISNGWQTLTGTDTQSVMFYPSYVHPECTGRSTRTDLFISQRDTEGAMKIYNAQSNLVVAGNSIYMRKPSTDEFFRWTGSSFQWVGGPGRQFVGTDIGVFALTPAGDNTVFLANNDVGWTSVGGAAGMLVQCRWDRICRISASTADISQLISGTWTKIGGAGKKFVYGYPAGLYGQSPDSTAVFQYTGSGQNWNLFANGPFNDILPATSGVYAIEASQGAIFKLLGSSGIQIVGGAGAQFDGTSSFGLIGLAPDKSQVVEFKTSNNTWNWIGGPAKRIARTANGTVVALSPTNDLCLKPQNGNWSCVGQP